MIEPLSGVVDTALVGRFDTNSLAALAIGVSLMSSMTWMFNFLVHAPIQNISSYLGSGNKEKIVQTIKLSYLISIGICFILVATAYPLREYIFNFMSVNEEILNLTDDYFSPRLFGQIFVLLFTVNLSVLRGYAKVNSAFVYVGISCIINLVLSYLSLYVFNLGIFGVALATVFANFIGFSLSLFEVLKLDSSFLRIFKVKIQSDVFKTLVSACLNIFGRSFFLTTCFFLSTKAASSFGVISLAAHQIIMQIWLFASFFTDGVATTGNIVAARLSRDKSGLKFILNKLNILGFSIGLIFCVIFLLFKNQILMSFTNDTVIIDKISTLWYLIAFAQIPLSVAYVLDGHMFGLNQFDKLKKFMIIAFIVFFIPIIGLSYKMESLFLVWFALFMVGMFRLITNYLTVRKLV